MADDPNIQGPQDRARVNVNEDYEVRYWTQRFNCTPKELREAVKRVGPMVADVERALKQQTH